MEHVGERKHNISIKDLFTTILCRTDNLYIKVHESDFTEKMNLFEKTEEKVKLMFRLIIQSKSIDESSIEKKQAKAMAQERDTLLSTFQEYLGYVKREAFDEEELPLKWSNVNGDSKKENDIPTCIEESFSDLTTDDSSELSPIVDETSSVQSSVAEFINSDIYPRVCLKRNLTATETLENRSCDDITSLSEFRCKRDKLADSSNSE